MITQEQAIQMAFECGAEVDDYGDTYMTKESFQLFANLAAEKVVEEYKQKCLAIVEKHGMKGDIIYVEIEKTL